MSIGSPTLSLAVHGHFYQPPRQNPFTGLVDHEYAAAPFHDFNEKIWSECYLPNAELGNFHLMSFNIGPTLASWLATAHPATLRLITNAARSTRQRDGHGAALAQAYHHTILPLATAREKRLQIAWGVHDARRRFGAAPAGMWLPEAAVDDDTLATMASYGLRFTILAPWQGRGDLDVTRPYRVPLDDGKDFSVFFYDAPLSGSLSFDNGVSRDAARFATRELAARARPREDGRPPLVLIATDGELYGHHKKFRDLFLSHLLRVEAPARGYNVTSLASYLAQYPPTVDAAIEQDTSWSCAHGTARWNEGCACTGDRASSSWKAPLRAALRGLATHIDAVFEDMTAGLLRDPWIALEDYIDLRDGAVAPGEYWARHACRPLHRADERRLTAMMEMEMARQAMFVSCAWFFDDLDRIEPRIALAYAHRAVVLASQHGAADLTRAFLHSLASCTSPRTGRTAAAIYAEFVASVNRVS